ncbi:uncharacterized protein TM35_000073810 [Trypanosoma theileri]|uniref:Uncharacterized protein n=1 Tax=Trypanosoma theileri TaxID=67003 RepID=A0A1X0P203_9TRYP|nr:uncharacterized protein TM35_000073810 [Trypanosoma theileri]ORC90957.1 hypothetical protein TM35_000073810 [Trypanosoma theileri]
MLFRRWAGSVLFNRHRSRRGSVRALEELRKMAILEAAADKPTYERAVGNSSSSSSSLSSSLISSTISSSSRGNTAALQSLEEAVEATRVRLSTTGGRSGSVVTFTSSSSSSSALRANSLSHFMSECRRLRREIGEAREAQNRRFLRESLRTFWTENADAALTCCALLRGRDFGFVAGFGLVDDDLHVGFASLQLALHCVMQEKSTCSCMDMMLSLHYMARELDYLEKRGRKGNTLRESNKHPWKQQGQEREEDAMKNKKKESKECINKTGNEDGFSYVNPGTMEITLEEFLKFRRVLTTLGMERIHFFFLERGTSGRVLGSAEDALHALEFLALVKVRDADETARVLVEDRGERLCSSGNQYIVTSLFRHISNNYRELKFTSIVHTFRLLRVFLPILCPPPPEERSCEDPTNLISRSKPMMNSVHTFNSGAAQFMHGSRESREWKTQRETVDRILWKLCVGMQRKDSFFVNPFHFVQIMATLSRIPPHLLSRVPRPKRQTLRGFETLLTGNLSESSLSATTTTTTTTTIEEEEEEEERKEGGRSNSIDGRTPQITEEVWEYMVAKACIFIPSLTSAQRRRVCSGLRIAILSRENCFARNSQESGKETSSLSPAEKLLLPMVHELCQYPEDYQVAMLNRLPGKQD